MFPPSLPRALFLGPHYVRFWSIVEQGMCARGFVRLEWLHHELGIAGVVPVKSPDRCARLARQLTNLGIVTSSQSAVPALSWGIG